MPFPLKYTGLITSNNIPPITEQSPINNESINMEAKIKSPLNASATLSKNNISKSTYFNSNFHGSFAMKSKGISTNAAIKNSNAKGKDLFSFSVLF